ncbi:hypothetical protein HPULCUR_009613 [Helicostylum pulchrum]|uniref:Uncharacterized protein n=1 Tax=Helicostylum pulchrum TaxID=562976 RepID=A0ABP9YCX6_9FUNG
MWAEKKTINKLLDEVLAKKLKRYRIKETSALSELDNKKWQLKVKRAEDRIVLLNDELLKPIKKTEQSEAQNINNVQEDPKDEEYLDQGPSRRRLGQLKSIIKKLIVTTGDAITKIDVENECPDATPEEILVCLSILNSLKLDASLLYLLMNQNLNDEEEIRDTSSTALYVYGYNSEPLTSLETTRQNKDAIFNSVFDMEVLQATCKSYKLNFSHHITIISGLKTARLLDVKKSTVATNDYQKITYAESILKNPSVINEGQKPLEKLNFEVKKESSSQGKCVQDIEKDISKSATTSAKEFMKEF